MNSPINKLTGPGVDPEERRLRLRKVANKYRQLKVADKMAGQEKTRIVNKDTAFMPPAEDEYFSGPEKNPIQDFSNKDFFNVGLSSAHYLTYNPIWNKLRNLAAKRMAIQSKAGKAKNILGKYTFANPEARRNARIENQYLAFRTKQPFTQYAFSPSYKIPPKYS